MNESCHGCKFWSKWSHAPEGTCHRYAPRPTTNYNDRVLIGLSRIAWASGQLAGYTEDELEKGDRGIGPGDQTGFADWPVTSQDDWCGDFLARVK